ncbi:mucin-5AC-like [Mixophyes fleayi]|uniref:mucin-5AC-like n=1 Tax=Mixophyes fleayi TaxID=3061075 RepID=UPI003F4DE6AC
METVSKNKVSDFSGDTAHFAELVVSSDDQYMYHQLRGFVGMSALTDNPDITDNFQNSISRAINFDKVCSYWNTFHYKTFNDEVFYFPGTCTYIFSSHCKTNYEDFVVLIRHTMLNDYVTDTKIIFKIDDVKVELVNGTVLVDGELVELPYSKSKVMILKIGSNTRVTSSIGLVFMKNDDGNFELQLDGRYVNQTCGLCGNLDAQSSFGKDGEDSIYFYLYEDYIKYSRADNAAVTLTETEFGNLQKLDGPTEDCPDVAPPVWSNCEHNNTICESILTSPSFASCNEIAAVDQYIDACNQDLCLCKEADLYSCTCTTVAQYSHECILHRGEPEDWRTPDFCPKSCPPNMEYRECSSSCANSCSNSERELLCDEHCVEGCFCPEGLIFDDIESNDCILIEECPCFYNGNSYAPGETYSTSCRNCSCNSGIWTCETIPCAMTCSIEGGSHITTFDQLQYTVYGDCTYVISKDCLKNSFTVLGDLIKCGIRETDKCLKGITIILDDGGETTLEIKPSGSVYVNEILNKLPVSSKKYTIFQASSSYIIVYTNKLGPLAVIQIKPIMQLYLVLEPSFKTLTCGLCGNFNSIQSDDLKTISGVIEGTAAAFVNTWKTLAVCPDIQNILDDPCSLSVENAKYIPVCEKNEIFSYTISSCRPTCRSLSEPDITCKIHFDPLPGYCKYPMTFVDCNKVNELINGAECSKSCRTLDLHCYSKRCVPGCVCPPGLLSDDQGSCIPENRCPCVHNEATYEPGEVIQIRCNTCVCKKRKWECTTNSCLATCTVYGDGHYITFDGKRYNFNGECQYVLAQDHCSLHDNNSTFRVITENIPCGTTGTTCSKSIKVFLGSYELILGDSHLNVAQRGLGSNVPYRVRLVGIYLVVEAENGLILLWDKKTSIFIKITSTFKGKLCGLCGNYDGNRNNDFTTHSNAIVGNIEEFGNSWKLSSTCPDAKANRDPCSLNPYRLSWAQKHCSIINSKVFLACHPHVDPTQYFDACVMDSCACNTGGDCECFCSAVAAYAQACGEFTICISWRSPDICPLFCDYYNKKIGCQWYYRACGVPCMKTCRNPTGKCHYEIRGLEGCYPKCPKNEPYFDEDEMKCIAVCGCYDKDRKHYKLGANVPSHKNCSVW